MIEKEKSEKLKSYIEKGNQLKKIGKVKLAIDQYLLALQLDRHSITALKYLGDSYEILKEFEKASSYYDSLVKLQPQNGIAYAKLARIKLKQGKIEESSAIFKRATSLQVKLPAWIYVEQGDIWTKQGDRDKAISLYQKAIEIKPNHSVAQTKLARSFIEQRNINAAVHSYYRALKFDPNNFIYYVRLGDILTKQRKISESINCYRKAIEINPNFPEAYCKLGYALTTLGKVEEAIICYKKSNYQQILESNPEYIEKYSNQSKVKKPNFAIVGSMKSGTSSLYRYIAKHPQFLPCVQKEIDFFSIRFEKGLDWYLAQFPALPVGNLYFTGEASTSYLDYVQSVERLHHQFPEIKLIAILRNPVDRAFSHYHHVRRNRPEVEQRSFEEAVTSEIQSLQKIDDISSEINFYGFQYPELLRQGYVLRGLYFYFIEKWMSYFSKEQFLILKSEDFYSNPDLIMRQVFDFLGVSPYEIETYRKYNAGSYLPISIHIRQTLSDFFKVHNNKLENYLEMKFNWF